MEVNRRWSWVCLEIMKSLWEAPSQATLFFAFFDTYSRHVTGSDASSNNFASARHSVWLIFMLGFVSDIYKEHSGAAAGMF